MTRQVNTRQFTANFKLISNFERTLFQAYQRALDRGHKEVTQEVIYYSQRQLSAAIENMSVEVVNQLIFLPTNLYQLVKKNDVHRSFLIDGTSIYFKTISLVLRAIAEGRGKVPVEKGTFTHVLNAYYAGVISFFREIAIGRNNEEIAKALNEFNQMSDGSDDSFNVKFQIQELIENSQFAEAENLRRENKESNYYNVLHRQAALCLKSWFIYLFDLYFTRDKLVDCFYQRIGTSS